MKKQKAKETRVAKKKATKSYKDSGPFDAVNFEDIGSNNDPCFGRLYDLSQPECRQCGDSEFCCTIFANKVGKTRAEIEKETKFKDLNVLVDKKAVNKTIRYMKRKEASKKEILEKIREKYELTVEESRQLYKEYKNSKKNDE